jgi:hypothetical protein
MPTTASLPRRLLLCVLVVATLATAAYATTASAAASGAAATAPTVQHVHFTSDPYSANICGIDVIGVDTVVVTVLTSPASGAVINPRLLTTVFTNPSSGKSVTLMDAGLAVASATIDNGDGTSTTVVTVDGLTKVSVLNGPLININVVGSITFAVTVDTATGDFISFEFLSIKGPGPNPLGCDVITAALT